MRITTQTVIVVTTDSDASHKLPYQSQMEYLYRLIASSDRSIPVQRIMLIKLVRATSNKYNLAECKAFVEDALRHRPTPLADLLKTELDRQA